MFLMDLIIYQGKLNSYSNSCINCLPERLCEDSELEREAAFQFKPAESGTYVFRFWQGEDQYLEIEAIVGGAN